MPSSHSLIPVKLKRSAALEAKARRLGFNYLETKIPEPLPSPEEKKPAPRKKIKLPKSRSTLEKPLISPERKTPESASGNVTPVEELLSTPVGSEPLNLSPQASCSCFSFFKAKPKQAPRAANPAGDTPNFSNIFP